MLAQVGKEFIVRIRFFWRPLQGRHMLLTNTLSAGSMLALGDYLQQCREIYKEPGKERCWKRTGSMFLVGCSLGPVMHYWYTWLDKLYMGKSLKVVGKKVLVDQIVASPTLGMWYFLGLALTEGHTLSDGWQEFKEKFWVFYKADCCVWPAAQMINFYFVSAKYRVIYINFITLGWDVYLSYLKHKYKAGATVSENSSVDVQQEVLSPSKPLQEKN